MSQTSEWAGRRVLVTGAGGFIGSHLAESLTRSGATTVALVEYNSFGSWGWLDGSPLKTDMEVVLGDVRDRESLRQSFQGVDVVFHLAALIAIPYSYRAVDSYIRTNVEGTANVLRLATEAGAQRVVHTSTSEVYGTARYVPIDESHPLQAQSPYAASKIGADKIAEAFRLSFGTPVVTLRPFNTYGPRQSRRAVIPTIITQAIAGQPIRLGNTTPERDFNYVLDTVDAFLKAGLADAATGRVINVGSGRRISIKQLVDTILDLLGVSLPLVSDEVRIRPDSSEVDVLEAANGLAREVLGWGPQWSLERGLEETIGWLRDHPGSHEASMYIV